MKCPLFKPLAMDMKRNQIDKEHYNFIYNKLLFDVIFSITSKGYEILVAIHTHNWGCVLLMDNNFYVELGNEDYYSLCKVLNLTWKENHFNSSTFLQLLSEKSPRYSSRQGVNYEELIAYTTYRHVEENNKVYFCGWNDHIKDSRKAHNFDKTEFFFGKAVADYCRKYNISSLWSDRPRDAQIVAMPWNKKIINHSTG